MKYINLIRFQRIKTIENIAIIIASLMLIYLVFSFYFVNHFFFNTVINGVNISLKTYQEADNIISSYVDNYKLELFEREKEKEAITGQDVQMQYNNKNAVLKVFKSQYSFRWIGSIFKKQKYYIDDLFAYNKQSLQAKITQLNCLNKYIIEPQNVSFKYTGGFYLAMPEVYGNKIQKDKFFEAVEMGILKGETRLILDEKGCYENPKYLLNSNKTFETKNLLNKYAATKINYILRYQNEVLDGDTINKWLRVNENLDIEIDEKAIKAYIQGLSKKYDTVGVARNFKASINRIVEVKGGSYGWKTDCNAEAKVLLENIKHGQLLEREPMYTQMALSRDENDIGDTYVEINITRQHLWFYKGGKLITQGDIVTGNPNKGNSTTVGTYMLNYKQKGSTLRGHNYEADVTYWMPFNGNIGLHDASWRSSFGGQIYKKNGTHGCVNAPLYLAKTVYENIEEGTPIICYKE